MESFDVLTSCADIVKQVKKEQKNKHTKSQHFPVNKKADLKDKLQGIINL